MSLRLLCLSLSVSLALTWAMPHSSPSFLHERRAEIPSGWSDIGRHSPFATLPLRFGLSQSNMHKIDGYLADVSHPDSANYGAHWTPAQVANTFAPSDETINAVREWLASNGFAPSRIRLTRSKGWIEVNATVEEAERLLKAEYRAYTHETGKIHFACDSYYLPEHIVPHVELVTPTLHWNVVHRKRSLSGPTLHIGQHGAGSVVPVTTGKVSELLTSLDDCDQQITPPCLRALYDFEYEPNAADRNSYGIVEYTPQAYVQSDLDMFQADFSPDLVGVPPVLISIDGGVVQTNFSGFNDNGESDLDLQYAMNLVTAKQPVTLYQTGDLAEGASFNNLLDALDGSYCTFEGGDDPDFDGIYPDTSGDPGAYTGPEDCGTVKPANVISTSYSYDEAYLTPFYTNRQCMEYAKLGIMGVTVLYSSGDYGVAGNGGSCLQNGVPTFPGTAFNPSFPGTCPYITSVGATQIKVNGTVADPEVACETVIYSGGGFSNYFAIPDYQKDVVGNYLSNYNPGYPPDIWNSTGVSRAYPDLSANGANYIVAVDGEFEFVYGTSASSPVVGAILTMINDARLAVNKSTIGFINPTIYSSSFADAFNDITSGNNPGCNTSGFAAAPGWDPVTGLGTPNFDKLREAWLWLP